METRCVFPWGRNRDFKYYMTFVLRDVKYSIIYSIWGSHSSDCEENLL
jgi:hypothetical protein